jgi:hypothetical protein
MGASTTSTSNITAFSTPGSNAPLAAPVDASPSAAEIAENSATFIEIYEQLNAAKDSIISAETVDA